MMPSHQKSRDFKMPLVPFSIQGSGQTTKISVELLLAILPVDLQLLTHVFYESGDIRQGVVNLLSMTSSEIKALESCRNSLGLK